MPTRLLVCFLTTATFLSVQLPHHGCALSEETDAVPKDFKEWRIQTFDKQLHLTLQGVSLQIRTERNADLITVYAKDYINPNAFDHCYTGFTIAVDGLEPQKVYRVRIQTAFDFSTDGVMVDLLDLALAQFQKDKDNPKRQTESAALVIKADPLCRTGAVSILLETKDADLRRYLVRQMYDKEHAFSVIRQLVGDPDTQIAQYALLSIAKFGGPKANDELAELVRTGNRAIRTRAALALASHISEHHKSTAGFRKAIAPYISAISSLFNQEDFFDSNLMEMFQISELPEFIPGIEKFLNHKDRKLRIYAAFLLLSMLSTKGMPVIIQDLHQSIDEAGEKWTIPTEYTFHLLYRLIDRDWQDFPFQSELPKSVQRELPKSIARDEILTPLEDWWKKQGDTFDPRKELIDSLVCGVPKGLWKQRSVHDLYFVPAQIRQRILAVESLVPYHEAVSSAFECARALTQEWPEYGPCVLVQFLQRQDSAEYVADVLKMLERLVPDGPQGSPFMHKLPQISPPAFRREFEVYKRVQISIARFQWQQWWNANAHNHPDVLELLNADEKQWLAAANTTMRSFEKAANAEQNLKRDIALRYYDEAWKTDPHRPRNVEAYVTCIIRSCPKDVPTALAPWLNSDSPGVPVAAANGAVSARGIPGYWEWGKRNWDMREYEALVGLPGVDAVIEQAEQVMLENPDPAVRVIAARKVLVEGQFVKAIRDSDQRVRKAAALRVSDVAKANPKLALLALQNDSWQVRTQALRCLTSSLLSAEPVLSAVIPCSLDDNFIVREMAIRALGYAKSPKAVEALVTALADPRNSDFRVEEALYHATGKRIKAKDHDQLVKKWQESLASGAYLESKEENNLGY